MNRSLLAVIFENAHSPHRFRPSAKKKWDSGTSGTRAKPFVFNKNLVPGCPSVGQNGTNLPGSDRIFLFICGLFGQENPRELWLPLRRLFPVRLLFRKAAAPTTSILLHTRYPARPAKKPEYQATGQSSLPNASHRPTFHF